MRGDLLVAVASDLTRADAKDLLGAASCAAIHADRPGLRVTWGISREHGDPIELPNALREARTALSAAAPARRPNVFLYEELGIVRLLLGSGDDPDLQAFIDDVTGPLVAYDRDNDGSLSAHCVASSTPTARSGWPPSASSSTTRRCATGWSGSSSSPGSTWPATRTACAPTSPCGCCRSTGRTSTTRCPAREAHAVGGATTPAMTPSVSSCGRAMTRLA